MIGKQSSSKVLILGSTHLAVCIAAFWIGTTVGQRRSTAYGLNDKCKHLIESQAMVFVGMGGVLKANRSDRTQWSVDDHLTVWHQLYGTMMVDYAMALKYLKAHGEPMGPYDASARRAADIAQHENLLSFYPDPQPGITAIEQRRNNPMNPDHLTNRDILLWFIQTYSQP